MATRRSLWAVPVPLLLAFTLLLAMGLFSVYLSIRLSADARATGENQLYGRAIADVVTNSRDAETGQRGYLLTGDLTYLAPYNEAKDKVEPALEQVRRTQRSLGRDVYARLAPAIHDKLSELHDTIALQRAGRHDLALVRTRSGDGLRSMAIARRILSEERQYVRDRTFEIAGRSLLLSRLLTAGLIATALLTIASSLLFFRQLRRQFHSAQAARDAAERTLDALHAENEARQRAEGEVRQLQKMESIGQLTGGIAHDFNNMLAVITGSLELAKRRLGTDPSRAAEHIDNAAEGARRAAALTTRLLAFSRRQPLAPVPTDLNRLVDGMLELLGRTLGANIRIATDFEPALWCCYADAPQIENAILNLSVNARDAMESGGDLIVATANVRVGDDDPQLRAGEYAAIRVTDTGAGMSAETLERAFDPFFTTKEAGRGTGLGLSQVFGFAKQSGGHVVIASAVGRGTTVTLYLPRYAGTEAEARAPEPSVEATPRGDPGEVILVVEDEHRVRQFAADALSELGYSVRAATSPADALATLRGSGDVRLLFTDVIMPEMNGGELAGLARAARPDLKVLYTTGYASGGVVHDGLIDVGVALLHKPYTIAELARKVRSVIDGGGVNRPV